jgi:hypothetical protein
MPPPLPSSEAARLGCCQRCRAPGNRPIRIRHAGRLVHEGCRWTRLLVCDSCIELAERDPRYTVLRAV